MSDVTPIRPEGEFDLTGQNSAFENTDPLEDLLDEQSDEDFGYVVTRDRATGPDGHPVKLAEWSAQDFASIYTRFRPHLERHARRFLHNPSQVDEVVQDAFLYLMVSLPELDSEIGVLRFLKWKVRLLCLDVMRASGKAYVASIDDVAEPVSADPEVSSYLEQQDDAAVLRLALSKLNPRHREVLLASIYEEKSTEQIAAQVGLSENATRQLIFRARAAFKKALLGDDVNTNGMSAAAILSVAARKAAMEAKKVGAQAMVFVLFMMLAIGAFVNFSGRGTQTQQLAESGSESVTPAATEEPAAPAPSASASESAAPASEVVQIPAVETPAPATSAKPALPVSNLAASAPVASPTPFKQSDLSKVFDSSKSDVVFVRTSAAQVDLVTLPADYRVYASQGIFADFTFDYDAKEQFQNTLITVMVGGKPYFAYPTKVEIVTARDKQGLEHLIYYASLKYLVDMDNNVFDQTELGKSTVRLELVINKDRSGLEKTSLDLLKPEK
jgi:RNA polymerase sigma-70 factor (ECF subfamily)